MTGVSEGSTDYHEARFDETNPFDQTLPLQIAGYARVLVPQLGWVQATLSPKWFESTMGRVMACTREETFDTDLVIEKKISGYHSDGSNHYEIFHFRGFTQHQTEEVSSHVYEARARHTFYPSGKVEDLSSPPVDDVIVSAQRSAIVLRTVLPQNPAKTVVQSVRGRYMGQAYINLGRVMSRGLGRLTIEPEEVQLSSVHHPVAGPLTNTFLFGTFKGKLSDLDGDGRLDVNTEPCHGTLDGKPDFNLDRIPDGDPFDPFRGNAV